MGINPFAAGSQPAGWSPAGVYNPVPANPSSQVYLDPATGQPDTSRRIDPYTKRFVFDASGNPTGMTTAQQLVTIAWGTIQLQNAVPTFATGWQNKIRALYEGAVAPYVAKGILQIVNFDLIRFGQNGLKLTITWRDLTSGIEQDYVRNSG